VNLRDLAIKPIPFRILLEYRFMLFIGDWISGTQMARQLRFLPGPLKLYSFIRTQEAPLRHKNTWSAVILLGKLGLIGRNGWMQADGSLPVNDHLHFLSRCEL